jgi:hypothetical protein
MSNEPKTHQDLVFDGNLVLDEVERNQARQNLSSNLLLRLPPALKSALTVEAARLTMARGSRMSVNTLIVQLLDQAILDKASRQHQAA